LNFQKANRETNWSGYLPYSNFLWGAGHGLYVTAHWSLVISHYKKLKFFKNWSQNQLVKLIRDWLHKPQNPNERNVSQKLKKKNVPTS